MLSLGQPVSGPSQGFITELSIKNNITCPTGTGNPHEQQCFSELAPLRPFLSTTENQSLDTHYPQLFDAEIICGIKNHSTEETKTWNQQQCHWVSLVQLQIEVVLSDHGRKIIWILRSRFVFFQSWEDDLDMKISNSKIGNEAFNHLYFGFADQFFLFVFIVPHIGFLNESKDQRILCFCFIPVFQ